MVKRIGIFNPFKRKKKKYSDYVIDIGKLKDKGIIQEPVEPEEINLEDSSASETKETEASGLGFLSSLADAGSDESSTKSYRTNRISKKFEDKVDMISDRIYRLIERIDLLEHKMGRIEKRTGVGENH